MLKIKPQQTITKAQFLLVCNHILIEVSVTASVGTSVLRVDASDDDTGNFAAVNIYLHPLGAC